MSHVEVYRERGEQVFAWSMYPPAGEEPQQVTGYAAGKWRWRFKAANGRILADGGQGYVRRIDCLNGCAQVLGAEGPIEAGDGDDDWFRRPFWNTEHDRYDYEAVQIRDLTK